MRLLQPRAAIMKKTLQMITTIIASSLFTQCGPGAVRDQEAENSKSEKIPDEVLQVILKEFPGALPYRAAMDTVLYRMRLAGVESDEILLGSSICVDDITSTKDKLPPNIKGPFTFGGLAGLPFTGITGVSAFVHHVPEEGTALLLVGPHIGYNSKEGWGKILRHGQHESSSCCGALFAALEKSQAKKIKVESPTEDDYQEQVIEQLAFAHEQEILSASNPLVELTRITCREAERKMTDYAQKVHERHFKYAVVVVGVIINTDYQYDDYLWIDHLAVKDIEQDKWIVIRE
jgi:hypothetical protein